jgi:hypothetical protein
MVFGGSFLKGIIGWGVKLTTNLITAEIMSGRAIPPLSYASS